MKTGKVDIVSEKLLYHGWSKLKEYTIDYRFANGEKARLLREIYNSGDGAAVLLYNPEKKTVLLVRQFRLAAFVNGHPDGFLLECCAGMLDENSPEETIMKEIEEETGYRVPAIQKVGSVYATPGAHMEKIYLYLAPYSDAMKVNPGGGNREEHEEIELVEWTFTACLNAVEQGLLEDAKTLMLVQHAIYKGYIHS